jgi:hypothetical protein
MEPKKLKLIIDSVGRYIIGELVADSAETITLKSPVILHVQPNQQTGQLQVQTIPLIFSEFVADKNSNNWTYTKASIVQSDVALDPRIIQQYDSIANPQPTAPVETETVKLFDE